MEEDDGVAMNHKIELIKRTTLLEGFSENKIQSFLKSGNFRVVTYKKNAVIHFDGDVCTKLELLLSGSVMVERIEEDGNFLTVSEIKANDMIGGSLLYSNHPYYPMTVVAQSDTIVLEIEKEILFRLLSNNPWFLRLYLEYTSNRTFLLGYRLKSYVHKTIREHLMDYLKLESIKQNSKCIVLSTTKKVLAEQIGVQRTSLSRELAKIKKEGLVDFVSKTITLL